MSTNSNIEMKANKQNPERGLVRFELNECLLRIAEEKFIKTGVIKTFSEALEKLYVQNLMPYMSQFPEGG